MVVGQIFSKETQAIFYNWKPNPVQRMLDFDFVAGRARLAAWSVLRPQALQGPCQGCSRWECVDSHRCRQLPLAS